MKYVVCTAYLFATLLFFSSSTGYGSDLPTTLRIGISDTPPFCFVDASGTPRGLYPDLINHIAKSENWTVAYIYGTWEQGLDRLEHEEVDLVCTIAHSPERARTMDFNLEPVFEEWGQVFLKAGSPIDTISDLGDRHVAVTARDISGINFRKTLEGLGIQCTITEYTSPDEVFAAVTSGEVDAGVASKLYGLHRSDTPSLIASAIQFSPFTINFATKKGLHGDILATIDRYLIQWKRKPDSLYDKSITNWTGLTAY